jgi:hypothetical protein
VGERGEEEVSMDGELCTMLEEMGGWPREACEAALALTGGSVEAAAELLLGGFQLPMAGFGAEAGEVEDDDEEEDEEDEEDEEEEEEEEERQAGELQERLGRELSGGLGGSDEHADYAEAAAAALDVLSQANPAQLHALGISREHAAYLTDMGPALPGSMEAMGRPAEQLLFGSGGVPAGLLAALGRPPPRSYSPPLGTAAEGEGGHEEATPPISPQLQAAPPHGYAPSEVAPPPAAEVAAGGAADDADLAEAIAMSFGAAAAAAAAADSADEGNVAATPPTFVVGSRTSVELSHDNCMAERTAKPDGTSWVMSSMGPAAPAYIEVVVEQLADPLQDLAIGDEVSYMHYSGCTVRAIDAGSSPATCSVHVPGLGSREHVPVAQLKRVTVPVDPHDELEERIKMEVGMLRQRLAAGHPGQDEDEMRSVFERRIMLLEEEVASRRGPLHRAGLRLAMGGSRPPPRQCSRLGVATGAAAGASLARGGRLNAPKDTWLLQGSRVMKGDSNVNRSFPAFLDSVNIGDRIGLMVDDQGRMSIFLNGNSLGVACNGIPTGTELFLVLDMQGSLKAVQLLPDMKTPQTQEQLERDMLVGIVKSDSVSVEAISAKTQDAPEQATEVDRRGRVPLHHLCENSKSSVEMVKCLVEVDPSTVTREDGDGNTPLMCLLKQNSSMVSGQNGPKCDRSHSLKADPRRSNYCDVCRATGTKYRCSAGCDYDMCDSCYVAKVSKIKKPSRSHHVNMIQYLIDTAGDVIVALDRAGKLPLQVAHELGLPQTVVDLLMVATREFGAVWCGPPHASPEYGIHLLVHAAEAAEEQSVQAKQLRFHTAMRALSPSKTDTAHTATKLNNLPFSAAEVLQSISGPAHVAFLLKDGRVFRLQVDTVGQHQSSMQASRAQQSLMSEKKNLEYQKRKLAEAEESLAKLDSRRYAVSDDEIEQLVAISAKTTEECKEILSRYPPGGTRMSLASNEVFGMELAGGEVDDFAQGDKRGELKYAIKGIKKKVLQVESRVAQLAAAVEKEKESSSSVAVLSVGMLDYWQIDQADSASVVSIGGTQTQLTALSNTGKLYNWPWNASDAVLDPQAAALCPSADEDPIVSVSCSDLRTSILTREGKIASWMDKFCHHDVGSCDDGTVQPSILAAGGLEHQATAFECFDSQVIQIAVSDHGTCAATIKGSVYWWGRRPWPMRLNRIQPEPTTGGSVDLDGIYAEYASTFSKKDRKTMESQETLISLATNSVELENYLLTKVSGTGPEVHSRRRTLRRLCEVLRQPADGLEEGDVVVCQPSSSDWCLYPQGSTAIASLDGHPAIVTIDKSVDRIANTKVQVKHNGAQVQCDQQDLLFLQLERKQKELVLQTIDQARGMAVALPPGRSADDDCSDDYAIVDIESVSKKTDTHDELEALLPEPIQIMQAERLLEPIARYAASVDVSSIGIAKAAKGKVSTEAEGVAQRIDNMVSFYRSPAEDDHDTTEPVLASFYQATVPACTEPEPELQPEPEPKQESRDLPLYKIECIAIDMWSVHALIRQAGTLYHFVAKLSTGNWSLAPERCIEPTSIGGRILVANATGFPIMHIDESNYLCGSAAQSLPAIHFASVGQHENKLWGMNVVIGTFGFSEEPQVKRCNMLHDAAVDPSQSMGALLRSGEVQRDLPRLLRERDSAGATPYFLAAATGNLLAAHAIQQTIMELAKSEPSIENILGFPNIFGTPPLHALLGLGEKVHQSKGAMKEGRKLYTQPCVEVCDAGSQIVNGLYHPTSLSNYRGPTLYKKIDADVYIFRWKKSQWIMGKGADFGESRSRGSNLYCIPSGSPPQELPPEGVWQLNSSVAGQSPPPRVVRLPSLLSMILANDVVATAENVCGQTALEAYIRARARSPPRNKPDDIARALACSPAAVFACLHGSDGEPVSNASLDDFICRLACCGAVVAASIARSISQMARGNSSLAGKQMQAAPMGKRFMEACTRVFITLFSGGDSTHSAAAELHASFTAIFKEAPQLAIIALAKQADKVLQLVRVGLPLPAIRTVSTYTSPPHLGITTSGKMHEITGDVGVSNLGESDFSIRIISRKKQSTGSTAKNRKLERARIFHLCVVEVTTLMSSMHLASSFPRSLSRTYSTAHPWQARLHEIDVALMEAAKILQPSWEYLFSCTDIMEEGLALSEQTQGDVQTGVTEVPSLAPDMSLGGASTAFTQFAQSACGRGAATDLDQDHCIYLAFIMDALVRVKLCMPDPECVTDVLVPTVSVFQAPAPQDLRDVESMAKRELMLKRVGIDVNDTDEERISVTQTRDRGLLEYPLLKALFRWRRTLSLLTSMPGFPAESDSFLTLFESFDKKLQRVKQVMLERRRKIPETSQPLCIPVRRAAVDGGPSQHGGLCQDLFDGLSKAREAGSGSQPLCRKLDKKNPWYRDAPGVGEGVIRMVISDVAAAVLESTGAATGLMAPAPLVPVSKDVAWWKQNPMARVVPAPLVDVWGGVPETPSNRSVGELKRYLADKGVDVSTCVEKSDLIDLSRKTRKKEKAERLAHFRALGNLAGLCILHDNLNLKLPLFFCRHVYKFLLGRTITFTDFAFFDAEQYRILHQLVESASKMPSGEELGFDWEFAGIEGPSGELPVTAAQVHAFVLRKVRFEMVDKVHGELCALKEGLFDVLSPKDLKGLTADDLQLLLSGRAEAVTVKQLRSIATFEDARGAAVRERDPGALVAFEQLFWQTVEAMDETERLKLVGMATGSLVAPPKLTIKLTEVTNSAQAAYAQACIHELHVPDYRDEDNVAISPVQLKDILMRTAAMANSLGIDTM